MRKKFLLLFLITTFYVTNDVHSYNLGEEETTNENKTFNDEWNDMLKAIIHVESRGNEKAISKNNKHWGILQISPIIVKDCNRILGTNKYKNADRLNKEKSIEMFHVIQNYYNPEKNIEKAIRLWNGGSNYSIAKTQGYFNKVNKKMKQ